MTATTATLPARRLMTHLAANVSHALRPTQKTTRPMGDHSACANKPNHDTSKTKRTLLDL